MAQLGGQPILIMKEGTERTRGKDAMQNNIAAAKVIAEAVRTSLGPRGMDKMLVDQFGDVVITNDGATILKEIDVQHPAAKMMVEVAKTQDSEVGDGTTTSVILAGELLKRAEKLLQQKIHPTVITEGFRKAADKAIEILENMSVKSGIDDVAQLKNVAMTCMSSKIVSESREMLAELCVDAIKSIAEQVDGEWVADIDKVQIQKKEGESIDDTSLIKGIILDKEVVNPGMPKTVSDAKILLLQSALEIEKTEFDSKLQITSPEQIQQFLDQEEQMLRDMVTKIKNSGATVLICQKGIDDMAQHFLSKEGIMAVRRVKKSDLEKLSKATGGKIFNSLDDVTPEGLGFAGLVEERKIMNDSWIFIEDCKDPKSVVLLIRGGTELIIDEVDRALHDALCVVRDVVEDQKIVGGGGAPELETAIQLRKFASTLGGREQLAVEVFADSLDIVPKTLAENAGVDQIDILMQLRASHQKGNKFAGFNLDTGEVINDMLASGVVEPTAVKIQAIKSSVEAASMILRIDDVIAGAKSDMPPMPPGGGMGGGMPPGMGGMGGMGGGMPPGMM
ncbi:MAG: thermosome subunit [Candidatus Lokiarchaeota archaeon]|nr:thermosome subunit [Candidatus Lokiarchaeota archaeon]MBD3337639.1 thermosome subunit [Candidatus Lokiarchaeota archaeon]